MFLNSMVIELNDNNFDSEVLAADQPVLVDFWAAWCGPCKMVAPVVDELAAQYQGQVKVGKLNVDENSRTPAQYGIMSIPTLLLFTEGKLKERLVGYKTKEELSTLLNTL